MKPNKNHGYTREQLERMCRGKIRWADELSARAGGLQSLERRPDDARRLFTYKCPVCKGFHLTRLKQRGQEPITLETTSCVQQETKKPALNDPGRSAGCYAIARQS